MLLENVRVLAYLEQVVDRPEGVDDKNEQRQQRQSQRTAVLAIADKDTTRLMLGASLGELRLALHGQAEEDAAARVADADGGAAAQSVAAGTAAGKPAPERGPLDKAITSEELGRIKPLHPAAPQARIEIIRGNDRSAVTTR